MKIIVNKTSGALLTVVRGDLPEGFKPPEGYELREVPDNFDLRRLSREPQQEQEPVVDLVTALANRIRRIEEKLGL